MLHRAQLDTYGLDDWTKQFNLIYGPINGKRTIQEIWLHSVEHASELHEDLRIGAYAKAFDHLADLFCWLSAFASTAHRDPAIGIKASLHEIVLLKFPKGCFYCGEKQCICSVVKGRSIEDPKEKARYKHEALTRSKIRWEKLHGSKDEPKSLDEIVLMFDSIYDHINFRTPLEIIMAHLQEEVGEVASALNDFKDKEGQKDSWELQLELELEIADVVTWMVALFLKLDYFLGSGKTYLEQTNKIRVKNNRKPIRNFGPSLGISFSEVLWKYFQAPDGNTLWCPRCKNAVCGLTPPDKSRIDQ